MPTQLIKIFNRNSKHHDFSNEAPNRSRCRGVMTQVTLIVICPNHRRAAGYFDKIIILNIVEAKISKKLLFKQYKTKINRNKTYNN